MGDKAQGKKTNDRRHHSPQPTHPPPGKVEESERRKVKRFVERVRSQMFQRK